MLDSLNIHLPISPCGQIHANYCLTNKDSSLFNVTNFPCRSDIVKLSWDVNITVFNMLHFNFLLVTIHHGSNNLAKIYFLVWNFFNLQVLGNCWNLLANFWNPVYKNFSTKILTSCWLSTFSFLWYSSLKLYECLDKK